MAKASEADGDEPLKRLGGGRWETRDGRFTIEPASGTWSVVDAEETDDLGLPLVRGPFRSLTDAKAAIGTARGSAPPASPLAGRVREDRPPEPDHRAPKAEASPRAASPRHGPSDESEPSTPHRTPKDTRGQAAAVSAAAAGQADEAGEPRWIRDLPGPERGRARRLIDRLTELGIPDADSIVRRDLVGEVPAVAAAAIERRLGLLPADAPIADVVDLLATGRDDDLNVRWRLVDGDGREILVDVRSLRRARR